MNHHHSQSPQSAYLQHIALYQAMVIAATFRIVAGIGPNRKPEYFILYQKAEGLVDILKALNIDCSESGQCKERSSLCSRDIFDAD